VRQVPAEGGELEFLGRTDLQVKVRGFRIEPGEVEAALLAHPAVREAVVMARAGADGESHLVAYVAGGDGGAPSAEDLRAFLRARLPDYMVPAVFVPLAALPLGSNGKVDRKALPAPDPAAGRTREYLAPSNPIEESLAAACAELLGLERVGMRDNFFHLGGHSLLAASLVSRLRDQYGLEVTLQMVFEAADLLDLANRLVGRVLEAAGDLSLEELQALLAGESPQPEGAV
jgi:acyl carrier protein